MRGAGALAVWIIALFVILIAVVCPINIHLQRSVEDKILSLNDSKNISAEAIVVLGAKVHEDGHPSLMLKDRLECAYDLYRQGVAKKIICSGDHGQEDYDETGNMKAYLVKKGIRPDDIFEDHAGFSTYDTVYRTKAIFGVNRACYVSQEYHLYRTLYISDELGQESFGVICDRQIYQGQSMRDVRELIARTKDFVKSKAKPHPKYLGEKIDISGSGSQTDD